MDTRAPEPPESDGPHIKPGRYRHFKGGEYEVLGVAKDSESLQEFVVYRALYGERALWIRPAEMFCQLIERGGERRPRFEYQGSLSDPA